MGGMNNFKKNQHTSQKSLKLKTNYSRGRISLSVYEIQYFVL